MGRRRREQGHGPAGDEVGRDDAARALMLAFQAGDDGAFERLVACCKREVFALGYRYGLGAMDADDLAQEVFLRVYRARASYRPEAPFRAWLLRIATNVVISGARKRKLRRALSLSALTVGETEERAEIEDGRVAPPWQRLEQGERREMLERALAQLPETQRAALILNRFHEQSYAQVGAALGLRIPAVKSLLFRARQSLKAALEPLLEEP